MEKLKAVIIDDIEKARVALKSDLDDYCPAVEVVGQGDGVASGLEAIAALRPELVFLDIKMADGSGFDLLEKWLTIGSFDFHVIFTTAYDEFAIRAFRYSAVDYLLKPVDPEELMAATSRVEQMKSFKNQESAVQALLENMSAVKKKSPTRLSLSSTDRIHLVEIDEIIRCEAHKNYTLFILKDKRQLLVTRTMKEYDQLLCSNHAFFRSHHSHLVNLNYVKEFVKIDGTYLVLKDGSEVPVSVRKREALIQAMNEL